ncbi:MAG: acyltransferase [Methylococcaceae bacterium]|nr:acyltransferase [Methylococcaceae bacterium]
MLNPGKTAVSGKGLTHVAYLDSVRGLAALAVIGSHYVNTYDIPCQGWCDRLLTSSPLHIWWDGGAAVSLFFVLSGLVLSLKSFRSGIGADLSHYSLGNYCIVRFFRIWPPYAVALILSVSLYRHYHDSASDFPLTIPRQNDWVPTLWGHEVGWIDAVRESFLFYLPKVVVYLPHAWTLSIELVLSLLMPLGLLLAARSSTWLIFFTLYAIFVLGVSMFLFHFMLGILIAKYHEFCGDWLRDHGSCRRILLVLGVLFYTAGDTLTDRIAPDAMAWFSGLGAGLLLLTVFGSLRMQRLLSMPVLRYVGKISYSIYLIHFAVLVAVTPRFLAWLDAPSGWLLPAWLAGFAATISASVVFAAFLYHYVEVPSMSLGKRLGHGFQYSTPHPWAKR